MGHAMVKSSDHATSRFSESTIREVENSKPLTCGSILIQNFASLISGAVIHNNPFNRGYRLPHHGTNRLQDIVFLVPGGRHDHVSHLQRKVFCQVKPQGFGCERSSVVTSFSAA